MDDPIDWTAVITRGAVVAERLEAEAGDGPRVLAAALGWCLLRRYWAGADRAVVQRWREDVPEAMAEIATRVGIVREE